MPGLDDAWLFMSHVVRECLLLAHRDGRRFDGQRSLSGHCGHGTIFIAVASPITAAFDPYRRPIRKSRGSCSRISALIPLYSEQLVFRVSSAHSEMGSATLYSCPTAPSMIAAILY